MSNIPHGGSDKYYNPANKVVHDGDTARAADLNAVNDTVDVAFEEVSGHLDVLEALTNNNNVLAERWAVSAAGTLPVITQPDEWSSQANANESQDWASAAEGAGINLADGSTSAEESAKTHATNAITSESNAATSESNAETYKDTSIQYAIGENPLGSPNEPAEKSAKYWAADADTSAGNAVSSEAAALASELAAETYKDTSIQYAIGENPLGSPNEPAEKSAKYWADVAGSQQNTNLLLNSNFDINQRVYSTGDPLNTGEFAHDLWSSVGLTGDPDSGYSWTDELIRTITLEANAGLMQINKELLAYNGETVTCSVSTGQAEVWDSSGLIGTVSPGSPLTFTLDVTTTFGFAVYSTAVFSGLKLEAGSTKSIYIREKESDELFRCKSYYKVIAGSDFTGAAHLYGLGTTVSYGGSVCLNPEMVATPTVDSDSITYTSATLTNWTLTKDSVSPRLNTTLGVLYRVLGGTLTLKATLV